MESSSRSRSSPKRQKDEVIKSRSGSTMNVDTQNSTNKINLSNIEEESKSSYYESFNSEGDWDSSNQNNDEFQIAKHKELQNLWSQFFRDEKTESDLIKERPLFLLKRKLSIVSSIDLEGKEHILKKGE